MQSSGLGYVIMSAENFESNRPPLRPIHRDHLTLHRETAREATRREWEDERQRELDALARSLRQMANAPR